MAELQLKWLNVKFVERIMKRSESDQSIRVSNVKKELALAKGDNFASDMIRVVVEYSRDVAGSRVRENKSLIVKVSPTAEGLQKQVVDRVGQFDTEIRMMETALPGMNEMLIDEGWRLCPQILHTERGEPSVIVMEDLAPLGFRMGDRTVGLDLHHCRLAIRGLAKFHATSVALAEKEPQLVKTYRKSLYHEDYPESMKKFTFNSLKYLAKEVHNWPELGPTYAEKIDKLAPVGYARAIESIQPSHNEFEVINHGDCWLNNMLFHYDDQGKPVEHIFVDFQACLWSSPAVDILLFLHSSTTYDVIMNHRDALLEEYLDTLGETMSRLGCETRPPSRAALDKSIEEREFYGVVIACSAFPVLIAAKTEAKDMNDLLSGNYTNPTINKPIYRDRIIRLLPDWNNRGLLD